MPTRSLARVLFPLRRRSLRDFDLQVERRSWLLRSLSASSIATTLAVGALLTGNGCAARGPDLVARMSSAKSIAESFGYKAFGPPATGTIESGKLARTSIALREGCYQIFVFPGEGADAIEVGLRDPSDAAVGQAATQSGFTIVKYCAKEAGSYALTVKAASSGSFLAQPYVSGEGVSGEASGGVVGGTDCPGGPGCEDPTDTPGDDCTTGVELTPGSPAQGSTAKRSGALHFSCAAADGPGVVYRLRVDGRRKLILDLNAKFDAVVALYRVASADGMLCDSTAEMECSDDAEGSTSKSHIEAVVESGDYGVVVGGYDTSDRGEFQLQARLEEAPSLDGVCAAARPLISGTPFTDPVGGSGSSFRESCGTSEGDEVLYKLDIKEPSRVRLSGQSTAGSLVLSMRAQCEDERRELACTSTAHFGGVSWTGEVKDPGMYTVIADTDDPTRSGTVTMRADVAPMRGAGTAEGDTCKDARPITSGASVTADTLPATADMHASCAVDAAPDVVYKLDVKAKSHVYIDPIEDEGRHVIALQKACGDAHSEIVCAPATVGKGIDTIVDAGSYFIVVKARATEDFGRVKLSVRTRDVAGTAATCKSAPKLEPGKPLSGTTRDAPDHFASVTCGGAIGLQASGDVTYQFTLKERSKVNLTLKSGSFSSAYMSLRSDCADPVKGELVCSQTYAKTIDRDLDAGTYYVVVDGYGTKAEGDYTIELTTKPTK